MTKHRYDRGEMLEYLSKFKPRKGQQTWAQWLRAKRTSPRYYGKTSPTARQRQTLSADDAKELSKFFGK